MKREVIKKAVGLLLISAVSVMLFGCGGNATDTVATTMRILNTVGDVTLFHDELAKDIIENLRLESGDLLNTGLSSEANVSLDDNKVVTMDENSKVYFSQDGKNLMLNVEDGAIFFNVTKPLEEEESFDIATSTMLVGIRGTSGYVDVDDNGNESLIITDGKVTVSCANTSSGAAKVVNVNSGEKLTVMIEGDDVNYTVEPVYSGELPEFVKKLINDNAELLDRVLKSNGWTDLNELPEVTDEESGATGEVGEADVPNEPGFVLEGTAGDAITKLFNANDEEGLKTLALMDNFESMVCSEVDSYDVVDDMQYVNGEFVPIKTCFYGEGDMEFAREGDRFVIFLNCDTISENSRIYITLKGQFNSGNGGVGYSYESVAVSTDCSDKYIVINPFTQEIVEYFDAPSPSDAFNKFLPIDLF